MYCTFIQKRYSSKLKKKKKIETLILLNNKTISQFVKIIFESWK